MVSACRAPGQSRLSTGLWILGLMIAVACFRAGPLPGQELDKPERGIFITVANPITSDVVNNIRTRLALGTKDKNVAKVIFDFNPDGKESSTIDYGPCRDLAMEIKKLPLKTVAFVRGPVTRHSVLPVLACQQLIMSSNAVLGPIQLDANSRPDDDALAMYAQIASQSSKGREALVLKMLDPNVVVLEGRLQGASYYFDERKRAEAEREGVVGINPQPVLPGGSVARYTADEAVKLSLCQGIKESRQEVVELFQLSPTTLQEDPLQGRAPDAWLIKVQGPVDRGNAETLRRRIDRAVRQGANIIFLQLEANGGDLVVACDLAKDLRNLVDKNKQPIVTVAYIPHSAPDISIFLALGCTEIVMGEGAVIGQFRQIAERLEPMGRIPRNRRQQQPTINLAVCASRLASLAEEKGYPPLLFQALADPTIEVWWVTSQKGVPERKFITRDELEADRQGEKRWGQEALVKGPGQFLELTASKAMDYGVAAGVVKNPDDPRALFARYGVSRVKEPPADWLEKIAVFLSDPIVAMFLVVIGITGLILELKMPGVGIPGVIAAVCFVLFFWSQTQMNGQMTLLAVLLFLLGLVLLGIEIFLLPGFGVIGISGILLVLVGLGLATVERLPQTTDEWYRFGGTMTQFGISLCVAVGAAILVARYLPSIPYANRLVLAPPGEKEGEEDTTAVSATYELYANLLGAVGTAATTLRPAGIAQFGEALVDVVSEGNFVSAGTRVQVIEIEGNRVVVKEV